MSERPIIPNRDEFIAELNSMADAVKAFPFMPEEFVDAEVAKQVALYDVMLRGLEAMAVDEAEGLLDGGS